MRYFPLALLCFICVAKAYSQTGTRIYTTIVVEITKEKKPKKVSTKVVEITTAFPGGDSAWVKSIEESLNKTVKLKRKAKAGKYIASVRFLIERDGSVVDTKCLNDPGFEICEQVRYAIMRSALGRWRPVADSNKKVRSYHTSAIIFNSPIKKKIDSVRKSAPYPSGDLLPPEFSSFSLKNEYYGESDSMSIPTFYRGHVFLLTLRQNCSFTYETFYKPYSWARIEFLIGKYKISGDTISLTYESLLPGKADEIYISPTLTVSWRLPAKPNYLLIGNKGFSEPYELRLKKASSYAKIEGAQFELGSCK